MKGRGIRGIFAVSGGYIAAVIGAGFASGQEIVSFFVRFGRHGMTGIIISCVLFALFSCAVLHFCKANGAHSYGEFLDMIFRSVFMRRIAETAVLVCSAATFCVMTACSGEVAAVFAGTSPMTGAAALVIVCGVIFFLDTRRIMGINAVLGAVIIVGIIFTCFYILRYREHQTMSLGARAAVSGFSYAGYNLIGTGAVLAGMSRFLKDKRDAVVSSVVSGTVLFIMISLIWGVLAIYYGRINLGEIPMLTMTFRQNRALGMFYGTMLAAAVLTTAISSGFAVIDILSRTIPRKAAVIPVLLLGFCMSGAGFSELIGNVYRICGYGGAVISVFIIVKSSILMNNQEKRRKPKKIRI